MKRICYLTLLLTILSGPIVSCTPSQKDTTARTQRQISEVLAAHTAEWMNIPGVIGTGEGKTNGSPAIVIMVDRLTDSLKTQLPDSTEGYPVVIEQTGTMRAEPAR